MNTININETKTMTNENICARLIELEGNRQEPGLIYWAETNLAETHAERGSERAMFGDAWVGADEDVFRKCLGVSELIAEAKTLRAALGLEA
jgi:hypothetical protein